MPHPCLSRSVWGRWAGSSSPPRCFSCFTRPFPLGNQALRTPRPLQTCIAPWYVFGRGIVVLLPCLQAVVGVEGLGALPQNCLALTAGFFGIALAFNLIRALLPAKWARFVPIASAMSIPFYLGANVALDMSLGTAIKFFWQWMDPESALNFCAAAASGLIAGSGIWALPSAIMALVGYNPPVCMTFLSGGTGS